MTYTKEQEKITQARPVNSLCRAPYPTLSLLQYSLTHPKKQPLTALIDRSSKEIFKS